MFLGHIGTPEMVAGIGLGHNYIQIMGMMVINGVLLALDTLVSQAKGAGNLEFCGVILNRARFIVLILYSVMVFLSFFVESMYVSWGLDAKSAYYAQQYVRFQIIG